MPAHFQAIWKLGVNFQSNPENYPNALPAAALPRPGMGVDFPNVLKTDPNFPGHLENGQALVFKMSTILDFKKIKVEAPTQVPICFPRPFVSMLGCCQSWRVRRGCLRHRGRGWPAEVGAAAN